MKRSIGVLPGENVEAADGEFVFREDPTTSTHVRVIQTLAIVSHLLQPHGALLGAGSLRPEFLIPSEFQD